MIKDLLKKMLPNGLNRGGVVKGELRRVLGEAFSSFEQGLGEYQIIQPPYLTSVTIDYAKGEREKDLGEMHKKLVAEFLKDKKKRWLVFSIYLNCEEGQNKVRLCFDKNSHTLCDHEYTFTNILAMSQYDNHEQYVFVLHVSESGYPTLRVAKLNSEVINTD